MSENAWIEHDGRGMPVSGNTWVHVRLRGWVGEIPGCCEADDLEWRHRPSAPEADIIAYRLSGPSA